MLDAVCLLVSERAGGLEQKTELRMVGVVTPDKYELFEAGRGARFL